MIKDAITDVGYLLVYW